MLHGRSINQLHQFIHQSKSPPPLIATLFIFFHSFNFSIFLSNLPGHAYASVYDFLSFSPLSPLPSYLPFVYGDREPQYCVSTLVP